MRANKAPARSLGGYAIIGNAVLKAGDYHNWAEFHADGVWWLADPQKQAFMERPDNYIALRIIADNGDGPLAGAHRFSYSSDGVSVRMD